VRISDSALVDAAVMADRYIADRFLPDKVSGPHSVWKMLALGQRRIARALLPHLLFTLTPNMGPGQEILVLAALPGRHCLGKHSWKAWLGDKEGFQGGGGGIFWPLK